MHKFTLATVLGALTLAALIFVWQNENPDTGSAGAGLRPVPTNGQKFRPDQLENEGESNAREAWIELIHRAAPGTDWREMDRLAARQLATERRKRRGTGGLRSVETFANGKLMAEWRERGSTNQSGSLRTVTYVPELDRIFGIGDGGSLWQGQLDGSDWTVLNDDFLLHPEVLENFFPPDSANVRLVGASGKTLMTSDDLGQDWQDATFSPNFYDGWGSPMQVVVLPDSARTVYYLAHTWDAVPWAPRIWLYRSVDGGQHFQRIYLSLHEHRNRVSMWAPLGSERLFLLDEGKKIYEVEGSSLTLLHDITDLPTNVDIALAGHLADTTLTLYALADRHEVYRSLDGGATWHLRGETPANAWDVGMTCSPFDPNILFAGAVNCARSTNGGETWAPVSEWWEYYDNPDLLHADIMDFKFFEKTDGTPFFLIANHGGLHVSYDHWQTSENIALDGLNIGQYYDVLTNPELTNFIYLGSQDQGWQWTDSGFGGEAVPFVQQWSGDYGQQLFSHNNQRFWTQYPGGIMDYYHYPFNPPTPWPEAEWTLPGETKPAVGWIVPTANLDAFPNGNTVFIGGGSLDEGPGSYLIALTANTAPPFGIDPVQFDFDFRENSNSGTGLISAIEQSTFFDGDRIYVTTDDGTFFRTTDGGSTWEKSPGFTGPTTSWIYTACILASKTDPETVWISGSGYSNPPVFKSTDGGMSWEPMSLGLPNTLVQEIVATPDESMLFAATTLGPFVYLADEGDWFPLLGELTPLQWYTSVEYIEADTLVRFGTYGRGVWDLKIIMEEEPPSANADAVASAGVKVFPNPAPASSTLQVTAETSQPLDFTLFDLQGKAVRQTRLRRSGQVPLDGLPAGVYLYRLSANGATVAAGKQVVE